MILLALLASGASAEEPDATDDASTSPIDDTLIDEEMVVGANEEIIVFGELEIIRRRADLEADLRDLGYREAKTKDGRTTFRPEVAWHPTVIIDDDGYVLLRRTPVRIEPWVEGRTKLTWLSCIPPFTPMCVRIGGWIVSNRKLTPKKGYVAGAIDPRVRQWRAAIVSNAMGQRLGVDIPDMLESIWTLGTMPGQEDTEPMSMTERRAALLGFWSGRACTPEGAQARSLVEDFLNYVVQDSPHAATPEEQASASAESYCGLTLTLD
ncbi:MAG: hypothetical protein P8R54_00145 [Myxococcota bacterium]|nr:hypothetical protein [Myxococcota bacterium]